MINRWEQGRAQIDQLIQRGRLTRVTANRDLAESHLAQAGTHLTAAATVRDLDPAGAFSLTYDSARLALAALLVNQGLRPRGERRRRGPGYSCGAGDCGSGDATDCADAAVLIDG